MSYITICCSGNFEPLLDSLSFSNLFLLRFHAFLTGFPVLAGCAAAAADKDLPGLNLTTFLAGMVMVFPVAGLRPSRLARSATEKVPNPTNCTLFPAASVC